MAGVWASFRHSGAARKGRAPRTRAVLWAGFSTGRGGPASRTNEIRSAPEVGAGWADFERTQNSSRVGAGESRRRDPQIQRLAAKRGRRDHCDAIRRPARAACGSHNGPHRTACRSQECRRQKHGSGTDPGEPDHASGFIKGSAESGRPRRARAPDPDGLRFFGAVFYGCDHHWAIRGAPSAATHGRSSKIVGHAPSRQKRVAQNGCASADRTRILVHRRRPLARHGLRQRTGGPTRCRGNEPRGSAHRRQGSAPAGRSL